MSQTTPLNVAAKPFVPGSGVKLNVSAKPFVPFPELSGEKTGEEEQATSQSTEPSTSTDSTSITQSDAQSTDAAVPETPVKAALPQFTSRRANKAGNANKVRQVKSATNDDDDDADAKKASAAKTAAAGSASAVTAASAERRDESAITAVGIVNSTGEAWRYDAKFMLSLRDLPICTVINAAWMQGYDGLFKPQIQHNNSKHERESTRSETGSGWRDAPAAGQSLALKPGANLRPGSLRPGASGNQSSVSRLQQQQPMYKQEQGRGSPRGDKGGDRRNQNNDNGRRRGPDAPMNIEIAPLTKSENRYVVVKDIPPDAKLLRALNSILNKLTPEKFDTLLAQVLELKITDVGLLRDCVTAVFEKALAEPNFSPMYAEFCVKLSTALPTFEDQTGETNFRKLILNRCQTEFQDPIHALPSDKLAAMSDIDRDDHLAMAKRRKLGTIRFIGELYIRSMIASKILRECINMLFGASDSAPVEEEIEALCKLLETTGKSLATSKAKDAALNAEHLANTLKRLNQMKDTPGLMSSRIRFMIADVNDMQARGWVSRKHVEQAKKISDLHAEQQAAQEQAALQQLYQGLSNPQQQGPVKHKMARATDRYALPSTPAKPAPVAPGEWSTVSRGPSARKMPPQASSPRHAIPMSALSDAGSASNGPVNAYALLNGDDRAEERHDEEDEPVRVSAPKASSFKKEMTEEQKLDKLEMVLSDYFTSQDLNDADLSIEELHLAPIPVAFIENSVGRVVEAKEKERLGLVAVLDKFVERDYLTPATIVEGLNNMIARIDDLQIDVPSCDQHIALIIGQLAVRNVIGLEWLTPEVLEQTGSAQSGLKFITSLFNSIKTKNDEAALQTVVKAAQAKGWSLDAALSGSQADSKKYLTDKKLESLVGLL